MKKLEKYAQLIKSGQKESHSHVLADKETDFSFATFSFTCSDDDDVNEVADAFNEFSMEQMFEIVDKTRVIAALKETSGQDIDVDNIGFYLTTNNNEINIIFNT